jgi:hypothetical protein
MIANPSTTTESASMFFEEESLRQLLSSPYGQSSFLALLDALDAGQEVSVRLGTGRTIVIKDAADALELLRNEFDWRPWSPESHGFRDL